MIKPTRIILLKQAVKITIIYLILGFIWILLSDKAVALLFHNTEAIICVNSIKDSIYVIFTAALLFLLISKEIHKIAADSNEYEKSNTIFSAILESSPDIVVFSLDSNCCYTSFNNKHRFGMQHLWGHEIEVGDCILDLVDDEAEKHRLKVNFDRALDGESFASDLVFSNDKYSRIYWTNFYAPVKSKEGNIVGLTCFSANLTAQKLAEEERNNLVHEVQAKHTLLSTLMNSIPDLVFYKDCEGIYRGCNTAFEKFVGKKEKELVGLTDIDLFERGKAESYINGDREILNQGVPRKGEGIVTYPDGTVAFLETLLAPYFDTGDNILGLIGISRDITDRKKKESEILELMYHDALTGVHNRTFYEKELKRLDTANYLPLSIIIGDINGLKLINDAFGHPEGDKLLIETSKILKASVRDNDVLARLGGDEFCILLPNTDSQAAQLIVNNIKHTCDQQNSYSKKETHVSISLGNATKTQIEESFGKVFRVAEEDMYRRKMLQYKSQHSSIMSSIKNTMFEKSHETEAHAERLAELSEKLGKALGLTDKELIELELLSTLHDIGKISIDESILTKHGQLTEEEWREIKRHPEVGYRITQTIPELKHISEYILSHHERWDGKGYPQGLSGDDIPLLSRILAVVDSYDAMTEDRVYRSAMSKEAAISEIILNSGKQFDPNIALIFINNVLLNFS